jgi:hypothetical protein
MRLRTVLIGVAVLAMAFIGATLAMQVFWPAAGGGGRRPALAEVPPLPVVSRTSTIVAPTAITLGALREMLEAQAPRDLSGKRDNIASKVLSNAEIGWTVNRGPLGVAGKPDVACDGPACDVGGRRPRQRDRRRLGQRPRPQR